MFRIHRGDAGNSIYTDTKKGSPKAPRTANRFRQFLEDELRRDRDAARIAGEHLRSLVEHRAGRNREVVHRRAGESDRSHVADVAADVLRVVEDVKEASVESDLILLGDRDALRSEEHTSELQSLRH